MLDPMSARPPAPTLVAAATPRSPHVIKAKPDPKPMRFALAAAGLAAMSALGAGIVLPPNAPVLVQPNAPAAQPILQGSGTAPGATFPVQQPIQYVQLQAGQTAPPGAKVIDPAAPQPTTIVTTVAAPAAAVAPAAPAPAQQPVIIKTTQSGKVIP